MVDHIKKLVELINTLVNKYRQINITFQNWKITMLKGAYEVEGVACLIQETIQPSVVSNMYSTNQANAHTNYSSSSLYKPNFHNVSKHVPQYRADEITFIMFKIEEMSCHVFTCTEKFISFINNMTLIDELNLAINKSSIEHI